MCDFTPGSSWTVTYGLQCIWTLRQYPCQWRKLKDDRIYTFSKHRKNQLNSFISLVKNKIMSIVCGRLLSDEISCLPHYTYRLHCTSGPPAIDVFFLFWQMLSKDLQKLVLRKPSLKRLYKHNQWASCIFRIYIKNMPFDLMFSIVLK